MFVLLNEHIVEPDVLMEYTCKRARKLVDFSVDHCECFPLDLDAFHRLDLSTAPILAEGVDEKIRKASAFAGCGSDFRRQKDQLDWYNRRTWSQHEARYCAHGSLL
ncbi:hypothetical protein FVE85_4348 [Porphyridium purpureum]|uniref:Uncharacterized protein n=1 Tax=Porphyridium purpureum TaxID=35688 RepID=A0A5J4YJR3_PORPP|nr:hypothetical protein FVE85_4348 [Porphyridium purpureum]|eukprot:POR5759..scf270_19